MPALTLPPTPPFLPQALTSPSPAPTQGDSGGASFQAALAREMRSADAPPAPQAAPTTPQAAPRAAETAAPKQQDVAPRPTDRSPERNAERSKGDDKSATAQPDATDGHAPTAPAAPGQPVAKGAKRTDGKDKADGDDAAGAGQVAADGSMPTDAAPMFGMTQAAVATATAAANAGATTAATTGATGVDATAGGAGGAPQGAARRGAQARGAAEADAFGDAGSTPAGGMTQGRATGSRQVLPEAARAEATSPVAEPARAFETRLEQTLAGLAAAAPGHAGTGGATESLPGATGPADVGGAAGFASLRNAAPQPLANERIDTPVSAPGWGDALGQKVVWMANQDRQVAELHLSPPDLGPLQVTLSVDRDQATASFVSPHPEVRAAIEAAMPRLRDMMAESGITLGNTSVSPENPRSQDGSHNGRGESGGRGPQLLRGLSAGGHDGGPARAGVGLVDTFA